MCYPLLSNGTRISDQDPVITLSQSPFPCKQMGYLQAACRANGTTPIDFAAEQQCLCDGNYFAASHGCADCHHAHGSSAEDRDAWVFQISSLSTAECGPATPTEPFFNLHPIATIPSRTYEGQATAVDASCVSSADRLRNQTAVSAYYTGGALPTPGSITGDATARLTSFTNSLHVIFTPTGAKSASLTTGVPATTPSAAAAAQKTAAGGLAAKFPLLPPHLSSFCDFLRIYL